MIPWQWFILQGLCFTSGVYFILAFIFYICLMSIILVKHLFQILYEHNKIFIVWFKLGLFLLNNPHACPILRTFCTNCQSINNNAVYKTMICSVFILVSSYCREYNSTTKRIGQNVDKTKHRNLYSARLIWVKVL